MTYSSNAEQVINKLKSKLLSTDSRDKLILTIAQSVYASNLDRIHNKGKNVKEGNIGQYNTNKPLYVNPNKSPKKFKPKGRRGEEVFKSGKPHKTKFFPSYGAFRGFIGKEHNFVNLQLTGTLLADWTMEKNPNGLGYVIGFKSKKEGEIAKGHEKKYKSLIWGISNRDRKVISQIIKNWVQRAGTK